MIVSFEFIYMHKNRILGDFLEIYALSCKVKLGRNTLVHVSLKSTTLIPHAI